MRKIFNKGFTLLELLIVIGIIGVLSSITIVSYKDYSQKAKISNSIQWAKGIQSELGFNAVGVWSFDNIAGSMVYDESGNGNHGTISGAVQVNGVGGGKALSFDGVNDYVQVNNLTVGNSVTILAWMKSSGYDGRIPLSLDGISYTSGPNVFFYSTRINWNIGDGGGNPLSNSYYPDSNWHHFAFVVDGVANNTKLYIDGKLIGTALYRNPTVTNSIFRIGSYHAGGYYFNGLIDNVAVYKETFTQAQVEQLYANSVKYYKDPSLIAQGDKIECHSEATELSSRRISIETLR